MWFVWDGHSRQGPYSEQEICRRLTMGQWSMSVLVRPEERAIYRPLLWMLPAWCNVVPPAPESTARTFNNILNDATMIAPFGYLDPIREGAPDFSGPIFAQEIEPAAELRRSEIQEKTPAELLSDFRKKKQKDDFLDFLPEGTPLPVSMAPEKGSLADMGRSALPDAEPPVPPIGIFSPPQSNLRKSIDDFDLAPSLNQEMLQPERRSAPPSVERRDTQKDNSLKLSNEKVTPAVSIEPLPVGRVELEMKPEKPGESIPLSVKQSRRMRLLNQKPKMVSEGSVNLVENTSATQIRYRRVNPTAPRRRPRSLTSQIPQVLKYLPREFRPGNPSFIWLVVAVSMIVTFAGVSLLFYFFGKKGSQAVVMPQLSVATPAARETKRSSFEDNDEQGIAQDSDTFAQSPEKNVTQSPEKKKRKKTRKEMSARQEIRDPVQSQLQQSQPKAKPNIDVLRNSDEINKYLSSTSPSVRRFVVVGPLTLVEKPGSGCSPCQGKAKLADGTIVILSSVIPEPWDGLNVRKRVYARGMVLKTSTYLITVNSISTKIPR